MVSRDTRTGILHSMEPKPSFPNNVHTPRANPRHQHETTCWTGGFPVPWVLLAGTGMHFFEVSDPCCVEDFVDLGEI